MFGELYHNRVLELAADIAHEGRLEAPDGIGEKTSRLCGSTMRVEVCLDGDVITAIAVEPRACALGQAVAGILTQSAIGATVDEIRQGRDGLAAMLKEGAPPPEGRFWELRHLQPVKDFPPRHGSTLLAFEAALAAIEDARARHRPGLGA
jgi:NifU-like protein involved in Fe-S cluster formation